MGVLLDVSRVRPCNAVEGSECHTSQACQRSEDRALLLRDLGPLELVNHRIALGDGCLGELLARGLAAKGLQLCEWQLWLPDLLSRILLVVAILFCLSFLCGVLF